MPESLEQTATLRERLTEAVLQGAKADSLILLRELCLKLIGKEDLPEELEYVFEGLPDFLDDLHKGSFMIPLESGGLMHITLFRQDGEVSFRLSENASANVKMRFKQLGL